MTQNVMKIIVSFMVAVSIFVLTSKVLQFTAQRVELLGFFPNNTTVTVSNILSNGQIKKLGEFDIKGAEKMQRVGTGYINEHINRLKLEFEHSGEGLITLSRIKIFFPYLEEYYFTEDNVIKFFHSDQSNEKIARQYSGKKISVTSKESIGRPDSIAPMVLAALFFLGTLLLTRNTKFSSLSAFQDMTLGNKISSQREFDSINGIRGLAALLVLFSHTAPGFEAVQIGLTLLFVISGFLLAKPFVLDNTKIFSFKSIEHYLVKRLRRILPMYYLYVFIIFGVTLELETLARHLVFLQGDGHLWPMTQIFAFYMLLPAILIFTCAADRIHKALPIILLVTASIAAYFILDNWTPFYNGRFSKEFYLYAFLLGVLASYVQYGRILNLNLPKQQHSYFSTHILGVIALSVTILSILWAAPIKPAPWIWAWMSQFWVKCVLAAFIILLALNARRSFSQLILANWLFRSVGVIGFSFYLLHGLGMNIFSELQFLILADDNAAERSWLFVIGSFVITYFMALFSYSFIERPFFGYRKKPQ